MKDVLLSGDVNARFAACLVCPMCLEQQQHVTLKLFLEYAECSDCGEQFPIVDGIPILFVSSDERNQVIACSTGDSSASGQDALGFYQNIFDTQEYGRDRQPNHLSAIQRLCEEHLPIDALVLEIGPGVGALQKVVSGYTAVDYSVNVLREHINAPCACASAERLPFASESFHLIFSIACFEHVLEPASAFAEVDRCLKPCGICYLAPAWHCRPWAADGLPVRPYRELTLSQRVRKALIPIRDSLLWRGTTQIPWRLYRRLRWRMARQAGPTRLMFKRLNPNYETYWMSDSDATCSLDSHEAILYFESRGYDILSHGSLVRRLLARHEVVIARKPASEA